MIPLTTIKKGKLQKLNVPLPILCGVFLTLLSCNVAAQETTDKINETLDFFGKSTIVVRNINGGITVESYEGNEVQLEVTRTYSAKTNTLLERAKQELKVKMEYYQDTLVIALDPPCDESNTHWKQGWNGNNIWWNACEWNPKYEFHLAFKLKVPRSSNLVLSTIHEGVIEVKNVTGDLWVSHVHGDIQLDQVTGGIEARTIHGDIDLNYSRNPIKDAHYYTHHGDIELKLPKNSAAKLLFKSHDGDFYTDVDEKVLQPISDTQKKVENRVGEGITYLISNRSGVQLRNGTVILDFETWHGDVYVREQ